MTEFESLLRLLDDETPLVRDRVAEKLRDYGGDVSEQLAEFPHPLTDQERGLLSEILRPSRQEQLMREWVVPAGGWRAMDDDWDALESCLRQLSDFLHDGVTLRPSLSDTLDLLAEEAEQVVDELGIEGLRVYLFESGKLRGNQENYNDPRNADLAWSVHHGRSNPIGLALLFLLVARRLDLVADGVNFPGHFLCRVENHGRVYLMDCFHQGQLHDIQEILMREKGMEAEIAAALTSVATPGEMLLRVLRNLEIAFQKAGNEEDMQLVQRLVTSVGG
jgi:regulator of sirC expression with transglutaminase-like and TPR domain